MPDRQRHYRCMPVSDIECNCVPRVELSISIYGIPPLTGRAWTKNAPLRQQVDS